MQGLFEAKQPACALGAAPRERTPLAASTSLHLNVLRTHEYNNVRPVREACCPSSLARRHSAGPVGSSALAAAAAAMGATTVVALALLAATQHASQPLQAWPNWDLLGRGGWAARAVQLTAAAGLLLLPALCQPALHSVMAVSWPL